MNILSLGEYTIKLQENTTSKIQQLIDDIKIICKLLGKKYKFGHMSSLNTYYMMMISSNEIEDAVLMVNCDSEDNFESIDIWSMGAIVYRGSDEEDICTHLTSIIMNLH